MVMRGARWLHREGKEGTARGGRSRALTSSAKRQRQQHCSPAAAKLATAACTCNTAQHSTAPAPEADADELLRVEGAVPVLALRHGLGQQHPRSVNRLPDVVQVDSPGDLLQPGSQGMGQASEWAGGRCGSALAPRMLHRVAAPDTGQGLHLLNLPYPACLQTPPHRHHHGTLHTAHSTSAYNTARKMLHQTAP